MKRSGRRETSSSRRRLLAFAVVAAAIVMQWVGYTAIPASEFRPRFGDIPEPCSLELPVDSVLAGIFFSPPANCDYNSDGKVTAADLPLGVAPLITPWRFVNVIGMSGLNYPESLALRGGVAAGDYDGDGWTDLYLVRNDMGQSPLFHNRGDGTFEDIGAAAGITPISFLGSGPVFADYDGDGKLDLIVGGVGGTTPQFYRNLGNGHFQDVSAHTGIAIGAAEFPNFYGDSTTFGDYDRDGDLDLFLTHWGRNVREGRPVENLWRNNGDGTFSDVTIEAGVLGRATSVMGSDPTSWMFTGNFADINNDGWPDLVVASDYKTSRVFLNNQDGTFNDVTNTFIITDENGMGSAIGDFDNDGNLDWFLTSIWDPDGIPDEPINGASGNRLYRGHGDGTFEDDTDHAGVRAGDWGWGACTEDFNNDGHLDIFHVNGSQYGNHPQYFDDLSRLFIGNGDGTFTELSAALGIDDHGRGRGVVCFDYDGDGDIDILAANDGQLPTFYRNDNANRNNFLDVKLEGRAPNTEAIGARIYVTTNGTTQLRELRAGSNFVSQDPAVAHFGLGQARLVDTLRIVWPDQTSTTLGNVEARQRLVIAQP